MKLSSQIADRMEKLTDAEAEAAFESYCDQAFAKAEKIIGEEITNKETILPLLRQAAEKGISPTELAELLAQSQK